MTKRIENVRAQHDKISENQELDKAVRKINTYVRTCIWEFDYSRANVYLTGSEKKTNRAISRRMRKTRLPFRIHLISGRSLLCCNMESCSSCTVALSRFPCRRWYAASFSVIIDSSFSVVSSKPQNHDQHVLINTRASQPRFPVSWVS